MPTTNSIITAMLENHIAMLPMIAYMNNDLFVFSLRVKEQYKIIMANRTSDEYCLTSEEYLKSDSVILKIDVEISAITLFLASLSASR
jgi:hypothetical protein